MVLDKVDVKMLDLEILSSLIDRYSYFELLKKHEQREGPKHIASLQSFLGVSLKKDEAGQ